MSTISAPLPPSTTAAAAPALASIVSALRATAAFLAAASAWLYRASIFLSRPVTVPLLYLAWLLSLPLRAPWWALVWGFGVLRDAWGFDTPASFFLTSILIGTMTGVLLYLLSTVSTLALDAAFPRVAIGNERSTPGSRLKAPFRLVNQDLLATSESEGARVGGRTREETPLKLEESSSDDFDLSSASGMLSPRIGRKGRGY